MLNVRSIEHGRGTIQGIKFLIEGKDTLVITSQSAWSSLRKLLAFGPVNVFSATSVSQKSLDELLAMSKRFKTIIGIGGGMVIDSAKYVAWITGARLVLVPTVLSTNAFATEAIGVRTEEGKVVYVGNSRADKLIVDFDLLRMSPPALNYSGTVDVLSCHTATRDWEIAVEDGVLSHPLDLQAGRKARQLVNRIDNYSEDIRELTDIGLKVLLDCLLDTAEICQPLGHYRAEEGSEHFLFYAIEKILKRPFIHGQIVGLGIQIMSSLQVNSTNDISCVMKDIGLNITPKSMGITKDVLRQALVDLRTYPQPWHTIIDRGISDSFIEQTLYYLEF